MATIPNSQKTFSVNEGVNTVYGGSASMKALSQWYTMQDITDTVRPYKVYTALLTQSGGSSIVWTDVSPLTIGMTYLINLESTGMDFTNVGSPNNNVGTYFVATGTTPNSWGILENTGSKILEYNTGAPVVTVLENTIGDIFCKYDGAGQYQAVSTNSFPELKTYLYIQPATTPDEGNIATYYSDVNSIQITTLDSSFAEVNDILYNTSFEIRVYN